MQVDRPAMPTDPPAEERARGDTPPEQTVDDTDAGWGEAPRESGHESWLREQRPPHWG